MTTTTNRWSAWVAALILGLLVAGLLAWFQQQPVFVDPDGFYHAAMTERLVAQGWVTDFPALPLTVLAERFANQHFLYHAAAWPFTAALGPLWGMKAATIAFGALAAAALFWFIYAHQQGRSVVWPAIFAGLAVLTQPFLFRLSLVKATPLALVALLVLWYAAARRKWWLLAATSILFVYLYGGWILGVVVVGVYYLAEAVTVHRQEQQPLPSSLFDRQRLALPLVSIGATAIGLIANPFFPNNLWYFWWQFFQIGAVNYQSVIGVGTEWYPYAVHLLAADTALVTVPLILAVLCFALYAKRRDAVQWSALVLTIFFFVITLKSRRYVEYYVPFAAITSALLLMPQLTQLSSRWLLEKIQRLSLGKLLGYTAIVLFFSFATLTISIKSVVLLDDYFSRHGHPFDLFVGAEQWLDSTVAAGSTIFHSDWDEFPALFYQAPQYGYISGLDPTFLYLADPDKAVAFAEITTAETPTDTVGQQIFDAFGAEYIIVVRQRHKKFVENIERDEQLTEVYRDERVSIWQLIMHNE